jgi:para-nitrobenzyl esterase
MTGRVAEGWPIYTTHDRLTFVIDETDRIESDPHGDRRLAWENFLPGL